MKIIARLFALFERAIEQKLYWPFFNEKIEDK
jgi:hypothetical protein